MTTTEIRTLDDQIAEVEAKALAVKELLGDLEMSVLPLFERMDWAEEEIAAAARRHPHAADTLWHSFSLLEPTHDRLLFERVYRAHVREILERVARGQDPRPGTAAEVIAAILAAATIAPPNMDAAGLLARLWGPTFPEWDDVWGEGSAAGAVEHYEALKGSAIDELEAESRRRLTVKDRHLREIECMGKHNGKPVKCGYAPRRQLELPVA